MLQVRQISTYLKNDKEKKTEKLFDPVLEYSSINELLSNAPGKIEQLSKLGVNVTNLFATLNMTKKGTESRAESWEAQDLFLIDIDEVSENDKLLHAMYVANVADALNTSLESLACIVSGGGLHILVQTNEKITDSNYFKKNKTFFKLFCEQVDEKLKQNGLSGFVDPEVFAKNRMFRLPGSTWEKKGVTKTVTLVGENNKVEPINICWPELVGVENPENLKQKDVVSKKELSYLKIDSPTVEKECLFLNHARNNQNELREPAWYAALTVIARLENPEQKAIEYSQKHHSFDKEQTLAKLKNATETTGPRTCENIATLWDGCTSCQHYKKTRSPVTLKSKNFIATSHSGFHTVNTKGGLTPAYDDLVKFYKKEHFFINAEKTHYRWEATHWTQTHDVFIEKFAEDNFFPPCNNNKSSEFKGKVRRTNVVVPQWFQENTERKINLKNGTLNIDTMKLEEHSPRNGFTHTLDFEYDPEANAPMFENMLRKITREDQELQTLLLEFTGYALSGDKPHAQKALLLTGEGSNGKSTFLKIIRSLIGGKGAVTALSIKDLQNQFHMQMLDGARLNIMEETPSFTDASFWEKFKHIVTGGEITVANKGEAPYNIIPIAKMILTCNELPEGANLNDGYFRRLVVIPFNAKFSENDSDFDPMIEDKIIESELPGILNLALRHYENLKNNKYKLNKSKAANDAMEEYQFEVNPIEQFTEEHLEETKAKNVTFKIDGIEVSNGVSEELPFTPTLKIYKRYRLFAEERGYRPMTERTFSKRLPRALGKQFKVTKEDMVRKQVGKSRQRGYTKIQLRADTEF